MGCELDTVVSGIELTPDSAETGCFMPIFGLCSLIVSMEEDSVCVAREEREACCEFVTEVIASFLTLPVEGADVGAVEGAEIIEDDEVEEEDDDGSETISAAALLCVFLTLGPLTTGVPSTARDRASRDSFKLLLSQECFVFFISLTEEVDAERESRLDPFFEIGVDAEFDLERPCVLG